MKKIGVILCLAFLLCSCGKGTPEDVLKDFKKSVESAKSYKVTGNMEISNDEETFTYSLESYYLKDNYYKVILVNQTNNHEQIILKNNEDIYVITPALNKSFKFQSEWPGNSSQAYLLGSLILDINNDKNVEVIEDDNGYIIKTTVNYPNNNELKYQKIYLNNKKEIEKVEVYNDKDIIKIKVTFDTINLKAGLKDKDFRLEDYVKATEPDPNKNDSATDSNNESINNSDVNKCEQENSNQDSSENTDGVKESETTNIENIIYPLYIPSNTYLTSSETIETASGNRVILTFSGEKNFVLIEEPTIANNDMEIIPVYGEPLLLSETIGALSANSLSWDVNDISYYLASTELTVADMQLIANSLGNSTLVSNVK